MDDSSRQLSHLIDGVSKTLAEWAVSLHEQVDPELPQRYGPSWRRQWVADVQGRIQTLSQAVAVNRPALLSQAIRWSKASFEARDVRPEDLQASLRCLRDVLASELPAAAAGPACACFDDAVSQVNGDSGPPETNLDPAAPHGRLLLEYLEAVLDARGDAAQQMLLAAAAGGTSLGDIYEHVLRPAQAELGRMWHMNEISIPEEHYATATTHAAMSRLRALSPETAPTSAGAARRMVAATVSGDLHDVGIRMVADLFITDGWRAYYIGANVPNDAVIDALDRWEADLLAVSAATAFHVRTIGELIVDLRAAERGRRVHVIVGGPPFVAVPDLWKQVGADGFAPSAAEAVRLGNDLVASREG